jgi:DNA primase large subunit
LSSDIKVYFTKCSEVLSKRIYPLKYGFYDLNDEILVLYLADIFRNWLEREMADLYIKIIIDSDERLVNLNKLIFSTTQIDGPKPTLDILKSIELFPLCMKGLLEKLKTNKHLKYQDRQALCLFLKDAGMNLNDCIEFLNQILNVHLKNLIRTIYITFDIIMV